MAPRQISPTVLLILLCVAVFLPSVTVLMLGPLLVALAHEFQTSVALVGQLASATAVTWGITAPLAGPVSDAYGRRRMLLTGLLLMAVGLLGSVLAWHYGSLLAFRLLTGVGAALIPPNSLAALLDVFSPTERGKAVGWLLSVAGVAAVVGVPLIACLLEAGSWRLPFAVMGIASLGVWLLFWLWFPRQQQPSQSLAFFSHYREVGAHAMFWYVLIANAFQQMGAFGMLGYLAAYLMQTYQMPAGDTALPLALAGVGVIVGGFVGGWAADHRCRLAWLAVSCWGSGLLAALVFTVRVSPWATVALAMGVAGFSRISSAVTPILLLEWAGRSRSTAIGLFAVSNQMGVFGGASLGGLMLALGGFPRVGLFCLGVSVIAAVILQLKVRDSAASPVQMVLPEGTTATK
jgi:MFS transporter, DHA1 family, purine base/nucleoside efflux pump